MLIMITGLPGSGKTTFAEALAASLKAIHLNTDIIRGKMGKRGQYDEFSKSMIYAKMLKQTESYLHRGEDVIVDATFYKEGLRKPYKFLAKKYKKQLFWFYVKAAESVIKERMQEKRKYSEADFEVYLAIKEMYDPLKVPHLVVYSDLETLEEMIIKAREYMALNPSQLTV